MKAIIAVLILIVLAACLIAVPSVADSAADATNAQAVIETNRTAQAVVRQQSFLSLRDTIIIGLLALVIVVLLAVVAKQYRELRDLPPPALRAGKWQSGPNARWGRAGSDTAPKLPNMSAQELMMLYLMQQISGGKLPAQTGGTVQSEQEPDDGIRW